MTQPEATSGHAGLHRRWFVISMAILGIVLFVTLVIIKPAMPDRITLLAGPAGSADHHLALAYATDLRSRGLDTEVVVTDGEFDSWSRLAEDTDSVAILPSALITESEAGIDSGQLVALGSIGFSPLWLFHRADIEITSIQDLAGRSASTEGEETSGDLVARKLVDANGLIGKVELRPAAGQTAEGLVESFRQGTLDASFVTGSPDSDLVRGLLQDDAARFTSFERVEAYAARLPGVIALTAPEGVFDLANNVPPQDSQLLAAANSLVAHEGLNRAIAPMLLVTAKNVHEASIFSASTAFPSPDHVTLPLDAGARRYFDQGETGLSKFLPYKAARWVNHLATLVMPLLAAVGLLLKTVPAGLRTLGNIRLRKLFKKLEAVEKGHAAGQDRETLLGELDQLDRTSAKMSVPMSVVHDYIDFRQFLHDMRERIADDDGTSDDAAVG